jgi:FKBP-type peptidyl-prolyl cis-trans isomerase
LNSKLAIVTASFALAGCLLSGCASKSASTAAGSSKLASTPSSVNFENVTVGDAAKLSSKPKVSVASSQTPSGLQVKDLVVGTGAAATPTSSVKVQYVGVRYADGKQFDASWDHGGAIGFSLQQVVPGFTQGIGGTSTIAPMKVGGRRLMILPAALGYGAAGTPDGSIPPNAAIVFVVDLVGLG